MNNHQKILLIDDERQLQTLIVTYLKKEGYDVHTSSNAEDGLDFFKTNQTSISLVLLDIMLEDMDGFTACQKIRELSSVPIIMLTARASEDDRIKGLKLGADDYVVKPFSPRELMARIEATLRRSQSFSSWNNRIQIGDLEIDEEGRQVFINAQAINFTRKEYDLFLFLLKHRGQVFSREQLHERLWGFDSEFGTLRTVDTHIKTLRLKLKDHSSLIKTVWGVGYKFEGM
ncbi:transcriptional regulator [Alkalihalobacillus alcalophilus ATCC 27647 = CGMCC 1.3604]|uniref:Transcriptional regulator n=1 Tax=Alkalihalobacillus alcalophilus ATCC 27647 = CGMCC 1.3604 TaxID=1218173 RepID=A0A094WIB7_ALKAL|nr:response regulator transcription factor [Alkalihalobacillus alcalophilus]KGA96571.1 transcriptional regulator [Alkalihalobacillus alcalophilus ATCC 27647 = CGMCC 1.3604]MED1563523.1 response regulator transcription factor [Alkalihalobacillus alcalophilus]THG91358.1 transcriptional regulator [Alkalihalobacillus alcalophilus ATCC 27647 = CGMCC 1.3604]